jgi:hypothetical protein
MLEARDLNSECCTPWISQAQCSCGWPIRWPRYLALRRTGDESPAEGGEVLMIDAVASRNWVNYSR